MFSLIACKKKMPERNSNIGEEVFAELFASRVIVLLFEGQI